MTQHRAVDKGHGRLETRTCILTPALSSIERPQDWRDLTGVAIMLREREDLISGNKPRETSYFILSDPEASVAPLAPIIRQHWAIENKLHHCMDMCWGSDGRQVRDRNAAENFARTRRFCDGLIKRSTGWGMSAQRVRMGVGFVPDNALRVLAGEVIERERMRRALDPKRFKSNKSISFRAYN